MIIKYSKTIFLMFAAFMIVGLSLNANSTNKVGTASDNETIYNCNQENQIDFQIIPKLATLRGIDGKGKTKQGLIEGIRRQYLLGGPIPQIIKHKIDLSIFDN